MLLRLEARHAWAFFVRRWGNWQANANFIAEIVTVLTRGGLAPTSEAGNQGDPRQGAERLASPKGRPGDPLNLIQFVLA